MNVDTEIRTWLDAIAGDFVISVEAGKFVAYLRESDPQALADWLDERAESIIAIYMARQSRHLRDRLRRSAKAVDFNERVERFEDGNIDAFDDLEADYRVSDDDRRRHLRDMTHDDLTYAIKDYEGRSKANLMEAAFLRAVRRRVQQGKKVSDVFTADELRALRKSTT